jgi:hypothetical protein
MLSTLIDIVTEKNSKKVSQYSVKIDSLSGNQEGSQDIYLRNRFGIDPWKNNILRLLTKDHLVDIERN